MKLHQLLVLVSSLILFMPSLSRSLPTESLRSTGRNYEDPDSVEFFREKAQMDGITNLGIRWPWIDKKDYEMIRSGIGAWTGKGKRIMFLHWIDDGRAGKALVALPRTPTWNGWLRRVEGELDYGVITIPPGHDRLVANHLEGIIKVRPSSVQKLDTWFHNHAQTLAELRVSHLATV